MNSKEKILIDGLEQIERKTNSKNHTRTSLYDIHNISKETIASYNNQKDDEPENQEELWGEIAEVFQKWFENDTDLRSADEIITDKIQSKFRITKL